MANSCFVIAEAGVNHNGSLSLAKELARVARDCGADAVKFQTFKAELLVGGEAGKAEYQVSEENPGQSQLEMLRELELSYEAFAELRDECLELGIEFLSTPFDEESADFLNELGMGRFKIPSGEITNRRLIQHIASYGKPIILSTGMSTLEEVERAIGWMPGSSLWLLHCVSAYPAQPHDMNLRAMRTMRDRFQVPVGLSDHTLGISVALASAALEAVAIEKHFTLDRAMRGPDHQASLEPQELKAMIAGIREIESALGDGIKAPVAAEENVIGVARRSVVAARDLSAGHVLEPQDLDLKRPGGGIEPWRLEEAVGRRLKLSVCRDGVIAWEMLE